MRSGGIFRAADSGEVRFCARAGEHAVSNRV